MTPRTSRRAAILLTVSTALIGLINPVSAYPKGKTIHVTEGNSIQNAIASAKGGDKIVVEKGTYHEQLTISSDGISLVGHDATIVPPDSPVTNACSGLAGDNKQAGICVAGSGILFNTTFDGEHHKVISVGDYVKDVSVEGFSVQGFTGINIAVVGAKDASIRHNTMSDGAQYGALTVGSKDSHINHNTVNAAGGPLNPFHFIGICMDDTSTVTITYNDISGYFIGLCVQTSGAIIHDNSVHDCCIGAFVDPGIDGAKLHDNVITNTPPECGFGWGIRVQGATKTSLKGNNISGIVGTPANPGVGISVADDVGDPTSTGDIASGNTAEQNTLKNNDIDIELTSTGKGNVFKNNDCTVSTPANICPNN
ncbi:pectin lyase-like protein [Hyaloscypha hepaticicola]|uniref:Pectin lyase-like protein n=1 Tax=Hyaloscypha hepaticicola TaxID=2082293 RepID=A0A2J6PTE7_9HELO|nr:pectin lyase-like protein [Hyaloscypha hepaticicola]